MFVQKKKQPYSLDCQGGAMGMYHCALENMTNLVLRKTELVIVTDHELSMEVNSIEQPQRKRNFFVHMA